MDTETLEVAQELTCDIAKLHRMKRFVETKQHLTRKGQGILPEALLAGTNAAQKQFADL